MSLAVGVMMVGIGGALLALLIVRRDRQQRLGRHRNPAQINTDAVVLGLGIFAMVLGLGAVAISAL